MLLILSMALLPLGLIAVFASRESAQTNRLRQESAARSMAMASASALVEHMRPATVELRQALDDLTPLDPDRRVDPRQCQLRLQGALPLQPGASSFAILDSYGRLICATPGYSRLPAYPGQDRSGSDYMIAARQGLVRASVAASNGSLFGIVEFPADQIRAYARTMVPDRAGLMLSQGSQILYLTSPRPESALDQIIRISTPVADGQFGLELALPDNPVSAVEILLILLPILMWASGALIGWMVVDRLLLYPLGQMQRAVASFRAGAGPLALPRLRTPAHELAELAESFTQATEALTRHEAELGESLAQQKRLTREVHHRVKNNLQVISSLISLHARSAGSQEAAGVFALIQRRVDALALVHRHHYAEAEESRGISLRILLGELVSNMRNAPAGSEPPHIRLDLAPLEIAQELAVPVALLMTELLERALAVPCPAPVLIRLARSAANHAKASLSIQSDSLIDCPPRGESEELRFQRVTKGFARQLRTSLEHDPARGDFSLVLPLFEKTNLSGET